MTRVNRRVEFIENKKQRTLRFMKRRSGLINKARELSVLCGVDACMIINAPKENNNEEPPILTWSSSSDSGDMVQEMIKKFKELFVKDRRNRVYTVSNYFADKIRKAENMLASQKKKNCEASKLASQKKKNCEASKLSTWNSKFESMKEHELRDLANDLEMKINNLKSRRELMKNKRIKTGINSGPSSQVDQQLWSHGDDNLQPVSMMEPNYMNPMAMNSLHYSRSYNSQEIGRNQMKMAMNSIEDENNSNYQATINSNMKMASNSFEDENNYHVQPIAMLEPDVANPMVQAMFDHYTYTDSQPQFFYDPKRFVDYNSGAQTGANVFSSSFLMNPAMMSTDLPESFVYDHNAFDLSAFDCLPMQQAYDYRNTQMQNCVPRQSFYDQPSPPLMLDYSTNGHVSSQMQYSEHLGLFYNFQ